MDKVFLFTSDDISSDHIVDESENKKIMSLKSVKERANQNSLKSRSIVISLACAGIFLILTALGILDDYIKFGHPLLYGLIFIIGIFSFSCGIHMLKLELLDILIHDISGTAIAILLFDSFLDYQPQNTFFYAMLSVDGLTTLLIIAIIFGIVLFILDIIAGHFFMDLFPYSKVEATLSVFVIRPTILWVISLFIPGFSTNFFGAIVGVLVISSLNPRLAQFFSKIGVITYASPEGEEITMGDAFAHIGRHEEAIKCFDNALEIDPKNEIVWNNKGAILMTIGRFEEAIKCFDKAIELNPRLKEAYNNKGLVLKMRKNYYSAEKNEGVTYSNDKYGFSIKSPLGWRINTKLPPEMLVHFMDLKGGSVNLMAGPTYKKQESIEDLEKLALRNVHNLSGKMKSLKHIKVDNIEAVEAVYTALGGKIKKVGFVKDDIEYVISCATKPNLFDEYEPIFDAFIQSFKFN